MGNAASQTVRQRPSSEPTGVSCPQCGKQLDDEPNFCPACGTDLRGLSGTSDTLDGPLKERTIDGRYRILEKLGEGGMGAVYKVEHVRMGKMAALKLMRPDHAVDKALKGRFLQEARVVARLSHPNTVQVFDSGELEDGGLFIVMEYVPGKDLAWHLRAHGAMGEAQAVNIGVQLCKSLQEAHEAGIVHRDLKPANVMLVRHRKSGDDQVKLLDFGIAKLQEAEGRKSTTGDFVGTPAYMSPEQIRGETLDARSDLYSLGCLLFELVTGRQPYDGPTPISILTQHHEAPIPRVLEARPEAQISPAFQQLIERAMAKTPEGRWADAEGMRAALEQLQKTLGSPAQHTPMPVERTAGMLSREDFDSYERKLRVQRALAPVLAVAILALVLVMGWRWWATSSATVVSNREVEPNDQVEQATAIPLGQAVTGAMGASAADGDRDLFVTSVTEGAHRVLLDGVPDLNLTVEVLQLERVERPDGTMGEKLVRKLFLDDVPAGQAERVDGLHLNTGPVYLRVQERAFFDEPNRPSREKALVPYTLRLEPMEAAGVSELEPNDSPSTAQLVPVTRALEAWTGAQLGDAALQNPRPDAPFSGLDWFAVEAPADQSVWVAVVPPERGTLLVADGVAVEKKRSALQVGPGPVLLELRPSPDGKRRLRVVAGRDSVPGASYRLAVALSGDNGLAGLLDLVRALDDDARPETRRELLEAARRQFPAAAELAP